MFIGVGSALIVVLLIFFFLILLPAFQNEPIEIGAIISLSGFGSDMVDVRDAMQMAVDEVNESGGINGRELRLTVRDSESDPAIGVKKLKSLEEEVKPLLIVTTISSVSLEVAAAAEQIQIPMIALVSTNPAITQNKQWVYSFFPTAADEVPPILTILKHLDITTLGLLYQEDGYGESVHQELSAALSGSNVTVESHSYPLDTDNFSQHIRSMRDTDAIYAVGFASHLSAIYNECEKSNYRGHRIGPSTASTPSFRALPEAQGAYIAAPIIYKEGYRLSNQIKRKYEKRYNRTFNHYAGTGYEFITLISSLLEGSAATRDDLKEQLDRGFIYPGLFGDSVINPGDKIIRFPLYPARIKEGKLDYNLKQRS